MFAKTAISSCFLIEIPERGKHADQETKGIWSHEVAHVPLHPLNVDLCGSGFRPRLGQEVFRPIDPGDREAPLCQGDGASSRAATQVKGGSP
jgi:hypothetical protein